MYGVVNKTRYDLFRDFDAVTQIAASPYILTVHPGLPVQSVKDLVAYAKANPAKLNYASTGPASLAHLAGELFALSTGTQLVHVPYKGVGAALPDLLSGRIQLSFLSGGSVFPQVRTQKLKALAIASPARSKMAPDLPTMIEAGVPGFLVTQWHGLLAPRGTPRAIIERLHAEVAKAVQRPDVVVAARARQHRRHRELAEGVRGASEVRGRAVGQGRQSSEHPRQLIHNKRPEADSITKEALS